MTSHVTIRRVTEFWKMASSSKSLVSELFHPLRSFKFPKHKFGATAEDRFEQSSVITTHGCTMTEQVIWHFATFV